MDQQSRYPKEKLHVLNASFMGPAHVIGLFGFYGAILGYWKWQTIVLGAVLFCVSALGITVGYHRFFTHRSFRCGKFMQVILAMSGITALEHSIRSWVADHVTHHNETDKEKDPYNASRGFWHSHIGWILFKDPDKKQDYSAANHLMEDAFTRAFVNSQRERYYPLSIFFPDVVLVLIASLCKKQDDNTVNRLMDDSFTRVLVSFQHKYYYPLAVFFSGVVPILIASLWGDPIGGLIFAGFSRLIASWHATFCINSLAHWKHWGSTQPYSRENTAQDSWVVSLFTFGEGYHNYHHKFQRDYRNGPLWYNFDPSKWIIFWLSKLGLAWDLVRIPDWKIEEARQAVLKTA